MSILKEREKTHGEYAEVAEVSQLLKGNLRCGKSHNRLSDVQLESLDLICTKLARIVCGNPNEPDHWLDGSGYFKLGYNELQNKKTASRANVTIMEMDPDEESSNSDYYIPRSGLPR